MRGAKTLRRAGRWLRSRWGPRGLILLYHRVADAQVDPYGICVSPEQFAAHMAILSEIATPMSLEGLVQAAAAGALPPRAVAVTFDDGYADNLTRALPVLERYEVPATVFVVAGTLGGRFWWEQLARAIYEPEKLPGHLALTIRDRAHAWQPQDTLRGRDQLLGELHPLLRPLSEAERAPLIAELLAWAGLEPREHEDARPLTEAELVALAGSDLVTIGAHTVTHPPLAALPHPQQEAEIRESKSRLEGLIGVPVTAFAYPFGMPGTDYDAGTARLVREAGFACACAAEEGAVQGASDPYQLPRFWALDWDGPEFRRRLLRWL